MVVPVVVEAVVTRVQQVVAMEAMVASLVVLAEEAEGLSMVMIQVPGVMGLMDLYW
jgi:hypothetical protein